MRDEGQDHGAGRSDRALVIVPTYDEAENIERLVFEILEQPAPLDVVIVDDSSPDGTGDIADRLSELSPRVTVIHRPGKLGLGTAYVAGFKRSLAHDYGYAITMDADFSHNPRYLPALLDLMATCDLGIGSRYVPEGGTTGWPYTRQVLSRGANAFAKTVLRLHANDCTAGFRCYKATVLREIGLDTIFSSGYSFLVEMVTRCQRHGYVIGEMPIIFENRRLGRSKISRVEIVKSVYTILRLRLTWLPWGRWSQRSRERRASARMRQ